MPSTSALHEVFATVRQTAAAHASALDELERAFFAQTAALAADQDALEAERGAMLQRAEDERAAIAEERADWEAELARMTAVQPLSEDRFKLNVGGVRYDTSRATLTKVPESMLATMFGARVDMLRRDPEDGSIFLDRDGKRFGLLLDYLRDGDASQLAETIHELPEPQYQAMLLELGFFGLADAVFPPRPCTEDAAVGGQQSEEAAHDARFTSPMMEEIFNFYTSEGTGDEGLHYTHVVQRLGYTDQQVRQSIWYLCYEGHIYSTIDEEHHKSSEELE